MAAFSEKMDKILDTAQHGELKLNQIDQKFDRIQQKVNELETGINFLSVKQDEQIQQQEALKADNNAPEKKIEHSQAKTTWCGECSSKRIDKEGRERKRPTKAMP